MKGYVYLIRRKADGKKFVAYGDFHRASIRPAYLFDFAPSNYEYKKPTPFGYVYNVSSGLKCDPTKFSVIRQVKCDIK